METISFKHLANAGDLISVMAGIRQIWKDLGKKAVIYQQLNIPSDYYGQNHPVKDDKGQKVCMNRHMLEMITPLIKYQDYIEDIHEWNGERIIIDLDVIRSKCFVNMPYGAIQQWPVMAYPDMAPDLTEAWITVPDAQIFLFDQLISDHVLINFSERYRNYTINYFFLKEYKDNLIFLGTDEEHKLFCSTWKLEIPRLRIDNFLQLAQAIKACKFLLGNQSFCWNLAEAMKSPRILEICQSAPNCQPFIGKESYGFLHQGGLEYYFKKLFNK